MLKIPMQIYLDPETVVFYKDLAQKNKSTFAGTIRYVLEKKRQEVKETDKNENQYEKFLESIEKVREKTKGMTYHHPDLTDDELLYGK